MLTKEILSLKRAVDQLTYVFSYIKQENILRFLNFCRFPLNVHLVLKNNFDKFLLMLYLGQVITQQGQSTARDIDILRRTTPSINKNIMVKIFKYIASCRQRMYLASSRNRTGSGSWPGRWNNMQMKYPCWSLPWKEYSAGSRQEKRISVILFKLIRLYYYYTHSIQELLI